VHERSAAPYATVRMPDCCAAGSAARRHELRMSQLAIVILNFNRQADTLACLRTLRRSTRAQGQPLDAQVIVLNYGLPAGAGDELLAVCPDALVQTLTGNQGYAGNNNVGIRLALERGAEWVLVLNEDTELAPDCLDLMLAVGEADAAIGVLGPMVYHYDEPTVIQSAGGVFDENWLSAHVAMNEPDAGQFAAPRDVQWVSGCAIMVRRAVMEAVGMLDERFFMYWEETEWCMRAARAGWRIVHVPGARLWHKGVRRDYKPAPYVGYYMTRNRLLFLRKHGAPLRVRIAAWSSVLRTLLSYSIKPQWRASKRVERGMIWRGLRDYLTGRWGEMPAS
jgi:GT2 family glycosyltransferase